ncbi:MAG: hypothetical protein H6815_06985 [Phycisphaeraceae bacterium]|nr:hypothetical protein [Phycisphaerales bacterium]MCB9860184.1 hypothetical protein [Phycisphaeraceae bacterium]
MAEIFRPTPTRSQTRFVTAICAMMCVGAALPSTALAQHDPQSRSATTGKTRDGLLNVEFKGGTIGDFLETIGVAVAPEPFNYIVRGDAEHVLLPAISLRNVTISNALDAVVEGEYRPADVARPPKGLTSLQILVRLKEDIDENGDTRGAPIFEIARRDVINPAKAQSEANEENVFPVGRTTRVLSLRDLTTPPRKYDDFQNASMSIDNIMQSLHSAMVLSAKAWKDSTGENLPEPEMAYHPESGMLLLVGSTDQLNIAERVFSEMARDLIKQRQQFDEIIEHKAIVVELNAEKAALEAQRRDAFVKANELETSIQSISERMAAEPNDDRLMVEHHRRQVDLDALLDRINSIDANIDDIERQLVTREMVLADQMNTSQPQTSVSIYTVGNLSQFSEQIASFFHNATHGRGEVTFDQRRNSLLVSASEKDQNLMIELLSLLKRVQAGDPNLRTNVEAERSGNNQGSGRLK